MTVPLDSADEFRRLTDKISVVAGLACDAYKERCLRRRIAVRMRARGVHTYDQYGAILDDDAAEVARLLDALTINVTSFFRNPETWEALASDALCDLWQTRQGRLHCWSAGCASGEEPYTLAMLLTVLGERLGAVFPLDGVRIDATDLDEGALTTARAGEYPESATADMDAELRSRFFGASGPVSVPTAIRGAVRFLRHDLTRDPPPDPPYDVIVCRNVVIYFDRPMQERLFHQFADALAPDGLLVLGKVETLFGPVRDRFTMANPRERIYRRRS